MADRLILSRRVILQSPGVKVIATYSGEGAEESAKARLQQDDAMLKQLIGAKVVFRDGKQQAFGEVMGAFGIEGHAYDFTWLEDSSPGLVISPVPGILMPR